jgi:3-hydroxymyristoyl/3-hydroxydecanoyl-(acyl carrier protein) dehydratase
MPGVLIIESLAQVGGLILTGRCSKENQAVFILSLDNVKFRRAVEPGDQLVLEANLKKLKSRTAQVEARALVNGAVAAEAEILYRLIDL